jgi:hypothetical protein
MDLTREDALSGIREVLSRLKERGQYQGNVELVIGETMVHEICTGEGSADFDVLFDALRTRFNAQLPFDEHRLLNYGCVDQIIDELISAARRSAAV